MNKKNYILIGVIVVLVIGVVLLLFQNHRQQENINAMAETMEFEKEQLEEEYEDLALQYDGYQINIQNDSLADLLAQEKQRVQDLREELRITKATDATPSRKSSLLSAKLWLAMYTKSTHWTARTSSWRRRTGRSASSMLLCRRRISRSMRKKPN